MSSQQKLNFNPNFDGDIFDNIEFDKLVNVTRTGWVWLILILLVSCSGAYLYNRYTKPIYSAFSILKLDIKNEANLLGLQASINQDLKGISGEIEILKSRLFLSSVVDVIGMEVAFFHPGRSHLVDERYKNSPFHLEYQLYNIFFYDQKFMIKIINDNEFTLSDHNGNLIVQNQQFGKTLVHKDFSFTISKSKHFDSQKDQKDYYFVIKSKQAMISYLEDNTQVEFVNLNANTIKISFMDFNPQKAKDLLQAIDTVYLTFTKITKNKAVEQQLAFLDAQMHKTEQELEKHENYFEDFTIQHRTTSLSDDLNKTISMLYALDSQRMNLRRKLGQLELIADKVNFNFRNLPSDLPPTVSKLFDTYHKLINERTLMLNTYNQNTQIITSINHKIVLAEQLAFTKALAYKQSILTKLDEIEQKKNVLEQSFKELPSMGTSYNKRKRLYTLHEELYLSLIQSKIALAITKAGTVTNFVILSPPTVSNVPIHPKSLFSYGIGIVAGLICCIFFIGIQYMIHDKITSQKELEGLINAPILGLIPEYSKEKLINSKLIVNKNPKSAISESLRAIRTNMEFIAAKQDQKLISVTSTVSGEGKTFVAVNLGGIFAYSGQKVVVVDLDMRKSKVHLAFDIKKPNKGVSTILIGKDKVQNCIHHSKLKNFDFITAGPTPPNPSELLLGNAFDLFLEELKSKYDIIFLDSPPVGLVTDGILVMKKVDLPIYLVRANYSKRVYLKSIQRLLSLNEFTRLSIIFNGVKNGKGYGYGYGYGYGHSGYYENGKS